MEFGPIFKESLGTFDLRKTGMWNSIHGGRSASLGVPGKVVVFHLLGIATMMWSLHGNLSKRKRMSHEKALLTAFRRYSDQHGTREEHGLFFVGVPASGRRNRPLDWAGQKTSPNQRVRAQKG